MGLFDKLFGSKENKTVEVEIYAPLSGEIVNIAQQVTKLLRLLMV